MYIYIYILHPAYPALNWFKSYVDYECFLELPYIEIVNSTNHEFLRTTWPLRTQSSPSAAR